MHKRSLLLTILPLTLAACGGSSESPPIGTSSSSSSSGTAGSGGDGAGGGMGGHGGGGGHAGMGGAGGGSGGGAAVDPTYIVDLSLPPPMNPQGNPNVTMYVDVAYGTDPLQRFDIMLPSSATPTPLLINIHGGGFVGGDKTVGSSPDLQNTLVQGIAFASINYRLLADVDKEGVIKPLTDCKRALQFIRYHAAALNIDPAKVALRGGSAGAGTSLWIGLHDEMASNADPVDKMSTRVIAMAANNTQATYDLAKWETVVFVDYGLNLLDTVNALGMQQRLASFYGMDSIADFDTPKILAYRAEVDMFAHMSADDPAIYVHNPMSTTAAPKDQGELFHHGNHARAVKSEGAKAGVGVTAVIEAFGIDDSNGQSDWDFLAVKLTN